MNVLVSAYACEPGWGSEPGVGWNVVTRLAEHHPVWVVTWDRQRTAIEKALAANPIPNLHFVYIGFPWDEIWWKGQGVQFHYYLWQWKAYRVARKLHRQVGFDVTHHITYVRYWTPSFLSLLPVPLIFGPVGGGEETPAGFEKEFDVHTRVGEGLRDLAHRLGENDPFVVMTARRSRLTIATTEQTAARLRALGATNVLVYGESGLSDEEVAALGQMPIPPPEPVRFVSAGRLLSWKGFSLGLRAFAQAALPNAEYWIIGDGPFSSRLRQLAKTLNVEDRVTFWGRRPRAETLDLLKSCHVLVHPSLHDSGGWVCLEAMASGRAVLCLDLGGPSTQVTDACGIKVAATTPTATINDLATAMTRLAHDSDLRERMGEAGRERVRSQFLWTAKVQNYLAFYETVVQSREPVPR